MERPGSLEVGCVMLPASSGPRFNQVTLEKDYVLMAIATPTIPESKLAGQEYSSMYTLCHAHVP